MYRRERLSNSQIGNTLLQVFLRKVYDPDRILNSSYGEAEACLDPMYELHLKKTYTPAFSPCKTVVSMDSFWRAEEEGLYYGVN